jgi:hypothetical protein
MLTARAKNTANAGLAMFDLEAAQRLDRRTGLLRFARKDDR